MQVRWIGQSSRGLGPQSICSYRCGLVICRVSREACGFVTVVEDFLISRCSLSHQAAWCSVLKSHIYGFLKRKGRWGNISLAQPATSWIMAVLTASYCLELGNVPSQPPAADSRTTSSPRQKGQNTEFANTFSLVTVLPMMKWMDCFQEELPQETRKHDSCRCGGKLDGKLAINWTELMLIWARDTEAQGYNWFLCYHSWDSLPFPMLLWAPVVSGAPVGNPEIAWPSPRIPPHPCLHFLILRSPLQVFRSARELL